MKYKTVIFDMDGTILNTLEDLADALNYALKNNGFPVRQLKETRTFMGNGIMNFIRKGAPEGTDSGILEKIKKDIDSYYSVHCADRTRPYPGIPELLTALRKKGYRTAVVSNKEDYAVQKLCSRYFDGLFDAYAGERRGIRRKPAPDTVNEVLRKFRCRREEAVYIGDSEVDIQTAENADMDSLIVDWGYRDRDFLKAHGAGKLFSDTESLRAAIMI